MEFKEVVNKRHSVRNFKEDAIPVPVLEDIVRTAERAPSWENSQPWNVYIATGETLKRIKAIWAGKYADKVKTPTLFIHSDEDYRCPLPEGMQMLQALLLRGVEARMCLFHGENHELSRSGKPKHRVRRLKEITEWFEGHTKE